MTAIVWPGSPAGYARLLSSVAAWCECTSDDTAACQAHRLLVDQDLINHLAFVFENRDWYIVAEAKRDS